MARAEKAALDLVASVIESDRCTQSEYLISLRFLDFLGAIGRSSQQTARLYLPYDISAMSGIVSGLGSVFGRNAANNSVVSARDVSLATAAATVRGSGGKVTVLVDRRG